MNTLKLTDRERIGRIQHAHSVECVHCGCSKAESRLNRQRGDDVMPLVPCQGSDGCQQMLCESCKHTCESCGNSTCREHLAEVPADGNSLPELWCAVCRERGPVTVATQTDAAIVAAMAREALEDAALIEGAGLTEPEARALFAGEGHAN